MPLRRWLDSRSEEAPTALQARIGLLLYSHPEWEKLPIPEALLAASEELMAEVLAADEKDRRAALDLLAADACVTYAFEAAAEMPGSIVAMAEKSMQRIAGMVQRAGSE